MNLCFNNKSKQIKKLKWKRFKTITQSYYINNNKNVNKEWNETKIIDETLKDSKKIIEE